MRLVQQLPACQSMSHPSLSPDHTTPATLHQVRLADVCDVDMGAAVLEKIKKNAAKYPADRCRGSAEKYTAYQQQEAPREVANANFGAASTVSGEITPNP